jgi:hypothetical protein
VIAVSSSLTAQLCAQLSFRLLFNGGQPSLMIHFKVTLLTL